MIFVVLGMHKSGTTLVSRLLHESGVEMGTFLDPVGTYESGHTYERASVRRLNDKLLDSAGKYSIYIRPQSQLVSDSEMGVDVADIIDELESARGDSGFKDPRTCLTYTIWNRYLPEHRIVAVYRAPEYSWRRYRSRWNVFKWPFDAWYFLDSWCQHNTRILEALASTEREYRVFEYYSLLENDADFDALEAFAGVPLADERIKRSRPKRKPTSAVLIFVSGLRLVFGRICPRDVLERMDRLHEASVTAGMRSTRRDHVSEAENGRGVSDGT